MITGDHPVTATSIAHSLGIDAGPGGSVAAGDTGETSVGKAVTGREIDAMSEEEFRAAVATTNVYARVAPPTSCGSWTPCKTRAILCP